MGFYSKVQIGPTTIMFWPDQHLTVTEYQDGTRVAATPNFADHPGGDEYLHRSISLGYNGDVVGMSIEHEVVHTVLAWWSHGTVSSVLWNVAHGLPGHPDATYEEAIVLAIQAWYRTGYQDPILHKIIYLLPYIKGTLKIVLQELLANTWYSTEDNEVKERGT